MPEKNVQVNTDRGLPYERFLQFGPENLTEAELLAVILRTGTKEDSAVALAEKVLALATYPREGLLGLHDVSVEELMEIRGIGMVKAVKLKCIAELSNRMSRAKAREGICFTRADHVAEYFMEKLRHRDTECVYLLCLDAKGQLIREKKLSDGSVNMALISPNVVSDFRAKLKQNNITISANDLSERGKIVFWPKGIHFTNYLNVMKIDGLLQATKISLARTVIGTFVTVIVAAFLGYMFTRETMWHRKLWFRMVAATMYFNAGIIPWFITMKNLGLTNNFWVYILPTAVQPFYIILCKTFVESIPKELEDAAEIDGAGTLRIFFQIIIPIIKPILATVAIFAAVAQWNSFQDTLLLVTDDKLYTLQYVLYNYLNQASSLKSLVNNSSSAEAMAASLAHASTATSIRMTVTIVVVTPIILVYPIFQRFFTKGIMIGAVKG